ncbi:hypothetical protein H4R21_002166 [Coemansia helicoidea]|uniref:Uncharacterized protein n=2 Tax=Coemansia TaxID=4863 RepID=A0ACC1L8M9_9FUNG|nr:hypothetical protein H4R21_002166 [Coemansia helicoidea]
MPLTDEPSQLLPAADGADDGEAGRHGSSDCGSDDDALGEGLYSPSALFKRQCLPRSAWESDEATAACRRCQQPFTLFVRRHHCRRCGLVVCDSCSSKRVLLAAPGLPASRESASVDTDDNRPLAYLHWSRTASTYWRFREQRICDPCAAAVDSLPPATAASVALVDAELGSSDARSNAYNAFEATLQGDAARPGGAATTSMLPRRLSSSSIHLCPVCGLDWAAVWISMARMPGEGWLEVQERHTRECLEYEFHGRSDTPSTASATATAQRQPVPDIQAATSAPQQRTGGLGLMSFLARSFSNSHDGVTAGPAGRAGAPATHNDGAGPAAHQSRHARPPRGARYTKDVVKRGMLPIGEECAICLEEYEAGDVIARLTCLCIYHHHCLQDWLATTDTCPVHGG